MDMPKFGDISSLQTTIYQPDNIPNARSENEDVSNHDMRRKFTIWSILGEGFSLTNSWFGISSAFITGIDSGGPALFVYGIPLVASISICVGCSLSELASAMPNAAGQHFWTMELAPKRYARPLSFVTGYCAWVGSLFASASVSLAVASAVVGCWQLNHPDFVIHELHVFIAYQLINLFAFIFNCYGEILPTLGTFTLYMSLISFGLILFAVPSQAPTHQDIKFVFATFINNTGWSNNGIAFIVGLVNANWAFSCLDSAVHLAEEVHQPEVVIPISIMATIAIGFTTAWFFVVAMFFSINNFDTIVGTVTRVPILELFYQSLGNKSAAILLESLIMATGIGCLIACHTWQSRLCWTFARDGGVPFHKSLAKINVTLDVPLRAHALSATVVAILGFLYLISTTAFNSMIIGCIVLPYVSYTIPLLCLLCKGRDSISHGPFWLGRFGHFANILTIIWTLFALIMFSFPIHLPVTTSNMNYISVIYCILACVVGIDWFSRGRLQFRHKFYERSRVEYESEQALLCNESS
ncbi:hypothetical protein OCU04_010047 [Sclerotinia nivalis]|uniref:Choline transport protein n=1 Tax=Sclerotinia nivalis TaxID=352851 RepID=A0A9X0AEZ2_9HELO|nr:hypothetical protein OCU04_010047 [Sclerotinia nivalis]